MGHGSSRIPRATIRMGAIGMARERASISARRMRTRVHTLILHNRILHNGLCPPCSRKEMKNEPPLPSFSPLDSSTLPPPPSLPSYPLHLPSRFSLFLRILLLSKMDIHAYIYMYILSVDRNLSLSLSFFVQREYLFSTDR